LDKHIVVLKGQGEDQLKFLDSVGTIILGRKTYAARTQILAYLAGNSAETSRSKMSRKILSSIDDADTPLRITGTRYFKKEHDEFPPDIFKRKSIVSPSNCAACHPAADKGDFDEHKVKIPKN
jgi:Dihaem cytochrome c